MLKWKRALDQVGVEFLEPADGKGEGVRFKTAKERR
jgi:hypothetical protein